MCEEGSDLLELLSSGGDTLSHPPVDAALALDASFRQINYDSRKELRGNEVQK